MAQKLSCRKVLRQPILLCYILFSFYFSAKDIAICYHTNYLNIHQKRNPKRSVCGFVITKSQISSFGKTVIVIPYSSKKCGIFILPYPHQHFNPLYKNSLFFSCFWYAIMKKTDNGGRAYEKRKQRREYGNPFAFTA